MSPTVKKILTFIVTFAVGTGVYLLLDMLLGDPMNLRSALIIGGVCALISLLPTPNFSGKSDKE